MENKGQLLSTKRTTKITYNNETHTLKEWSIITGIGYKTLYARYEYGWSAERIIETPLRVKHGLSNHVLYNTWKAMIDRCNNPKSKDYKSYGNRGIKVCNRWLKSVETFIDDISELLGDRPEGYSLDRIDNNGNYEPNNVKWSSKSEQAVNKRDKFNKLDIPNISKNISGKYIATVHRDSYKAYSLPLYNIERAIELRDYYIKMYEEDKGNWKDSCLSKNYIRK